MEIKDRMKQVRLQADNGDKMLQTAFAEKIGLSMSTVSQIERGEKIPSKQTIELVCKVFDINKEWLTDGIGEMKRPPLDEVAVIVADILDKGEDDPFYKWIIAIIKSYRKLDDKHKEIFRRTLDEL